MLRIKGLALRLIPAKAGIQTSESEINLDSRLRGNDIGDSPLFSVAIITSLILVLALVSTAYAAERNTSYIYPPWQHTWGVVRATPFKLRLFVGNKTHFNDPQGLACVRLNAWEDTSRTGDDDEITAYGVNSGDNCIIYNRSMFALGIYGLDAGDEKLNRPWGIAANARGDVYVADRGNHRVVRLFNTGHNLTFVGAVGGAGDEPGQFIDPCGVALDNSGNLYATDAGLGRVTVFDKDGQVKGVWEGFDGPDGIAVVDPLEPWSYCREGFAVVIDSLHQRITRLSLDGTRLTIARASDWGAGGGYLDYMALDFYNQLIITDRRNGCFHKLDRNLNYITRFGEPGTGDYQFDEPRGISIYRRFGQILVAERAGAQYLWVGEDATDLTARVIADSVWRDLRVDFKVTEPALLELSLHDSFGRFIALLARRQWFNLGNGHLNWGLQIPSRLPEDSSYPSPPPEYRPGEKLPAGEYILRARFRATYSSREQFFDELEIRFKLTW
jgi:hypothetical protein